MMHGIYLSGRCLDIKRCICKVPILMFDAASVLTSDLVHDSDLERYVM